MTARLQIRRPNSGRSTRGSQPRALQPGAQHLEPLAAPPRGGAARTASIHRSPRLPPRQGAAELARGLAQHAEAVCRHYLSNGRRRGGYWHVGDIANTPGQSLYVHLGGSRAGKWCDAATGDHGDLLDLIGLTCRSATLKHTLREARRFLALPDELPRPMLQPTTSDRTRAARRLFDMAQTIAGTLAETYLSHRGIALDHPVPALRFHPRCLYRGEPATPVAMPALLAAVTDLEGAITGIQRTWLAVSGRGKAPVATPRRALGRLSGNAVRFGQARDVLVAGEGIETVLSLKTVLPGLPMVAALSATQLANLVVPPSVQRLYVARDRDEAGRAAFERLARRARGLGITVRALDPVEGDFNDDLGRFGADAVRTALARQLSDGEGGTARERAVGSAPALRTVRHDPPAPWHGRKRSAGR